MPRRAKKRRASWASITEVERNRRYRIRYWAQTADGYRRVSETVRGTLMDAERRRAELMLDHSEDAPKPTVGECWRKWYYPEMEQRVADGSMSVRTSDSYRSAWRRHVEPRWGDVPVDQVRPLAVQQWISTLGASAARMAVQVMRLVMEYAVRFEHIDANPMAVKYVMPSTSTIERRDDGVWRLDELGALWRHVRGEWYEPAFLLMAFGGCRVGESLGVRVEDVSESHGCAVVEVRRQVMQDGSVTERLKNRWSRRAVIVPGKAGRRLLDLAASADEWLTSDGIGGAGSRWVLARSWDELRGVIEPWHPIKNLRNSWQTNMRWSLGLPPWILEPLMGHVGEGVTGRHYDKPNSEQFVEVVARAYSECPFDLDWDV